MVGGAFKSRSKKRIHVRIPSGKSVLRFKEKRPGKPESPTGKSLPGTARGTKTEIGRLTKTQRRPSRPYGGVLNSPELRVIMRTRAQQAYTPSENTGKLLQPGTVCIKIAGRDAGKRCTIKEIVDKQYVLIEGDARPRKVNVKHLEPIAKP